MCKINGASYHGLSLYMHKVSLHTVRSCIETVILLHRAGTCRRQEKVRGRDDKQQSTFVSQYHTSILLHFPLFNLTAFKCSLTSSLQMYFPYLLINLWSS